MRARAALAAALAGAAASVVLVTAAWAAQNSPQRVAIASFSYAPPTVEVDAGGTVEWTNLDPVVHTVTADQGQFSSGHMRQGQSFSVTFSTPGRYRYFCETHDDMRAQVAVIPPGPTAAAPTPTTTSTSIPAPSAASRSSSVSAPTTTAVIAGTAAPDQPAAPADADLAAPGAPIAAAGPVVASAVRGGTASLPAPLVASGVLLLALVGVAALTRAGVGPADSALWGAAALTLVAGALHAQLKFTIEYPEPIGTLMVIAAGGSLLAAAYLVIAPWDWTVPTAGALFHAVSLAAFAASRFGSLFGYHEVGWDPSPQAAATVAAELGALVFIAATSWLRRGRALGPVRVS